MGAKVQKSYQEEYWDSRAEQYLRTYKESNSGFEKLTDYLLRRHYRARLEATFRYLGDIKGKSLLDVGCGPGVYLAEALKRGAAKVKGVDISSAMIKCARALLSNQYPEDKRWQLVNQDIIGYRTQERFDVVLALGILEYLDSPETRMKALAALTSEILICSFPAKLSWYNQLRRHFLVSTRINLYSKSLILTYAHGAGLQVQLFRRIGPTYLVFMIPWNKDA